MAAFLLPMAFVLMLLAPGGCTTREKAPSQGRLSVVTTLFPLYDFARQVGGDRADVSLLLPPGIEPHSFEPRPEDIVKMQRAGVFVYTNRYMEPWAAQILKSIGPGGPLVVDASAGVRFLPLASGASHREGERGGHAAEGADPHIWLSIPNARKMVGNIAAGMAAKDPANASFYAANAAAYEAELDRLDQEFREGLASCRTRTFLHGGHYAFAYLADRYGLRYRAAYPQSAEAEPTPRQLMDMVSLMKKGSLKYIFYEEMISPRTAQVIAEEAGASLLLLHGIHNVSRKDLESGATYVSLMRMNLENLRKGLECK